MPESVLCDLSLPLHSGRDPPSRSLTTAGAFFWNYVFIHTANQPTTYSSSTEQRRRGESHTEHHPVDGTQTNQHNNHGCLLLYVLLKTTSTHIGASTMCSPLALPRCPKRTPGTCAPLAARRRRTGTCTSSAAAATAAIARLSSDSHSRSPRQSPPPLSSHQHHYQQWQPPQQMPHKTKAWCHSKPVRRQQ